MRFMLPLKLQNLMCKKVFNKQIAQALPFRGAHFYSAFLWKGPLLSLSHNDSKGGVFLLGTWMLSRNYSLFIFVCVWCVCMHGCAWVCTCACVALRGQLWVLLETGSGVHPGAHQAPPISLQMNTEMLIGTCYSINFLWMLGIQTGLNSRGFTHKATSPALHRNLNR